ncbi:metallophosphoesterase [Devosia sp. PTR5]|uniref:Metallophosphoesterase n=1 Tax=Devosia oryzisoli TaxID=2774138 RepID=A0A927FV43_9HYPH|nr:metallophosphoesterase [Devosia oryzisoli]MBD8066875.1 metallophosphoesterase [Devosia oryzisoli]
MGATDRTPARRPSWLARGLDRLGLQVHIHPEHVRITRHAPRLPTWPRELPLRIAFLSDLHVSTPFFGLDVLREVVAAANALNPDIILLGGDYEEGPRFSRSVGAEDWGPVLGALRAPLGVHAILGNHDYPRLEGHRRTAQARPPALVALEEAGIATYINRAAPVETEHGRFWLAGLGDQAAYWPDGRSMADLAATLSAVPPGAPTLLLAHEPDIFPDVPASVALTLSGHLHAGQVKLFGHAPIVPSRFGQRYLHGHFIEEGRHLIVGGGVGYSGLPVRVFAPSEIVLVELGGHHA